MLKSGWLICALLLAACGAKKSALTEQEKKAVIGATTDIKSRCIGRYLIDFPASAQPIGDAKFDDVRVNAKAMSLEQFKHDMLALEAELKATHSTLGYQFFFDAGTVGGMEHAKYFISLGDPGASNDARRVIEAYRWDRGYQLSLKIKAVDWTNSKFKDASIVKSGPVKTNVPEKKQLAFDLITKLQGRPEDEIPTEPGTCFVGGFMPGKAISEKEAVSTSYVLADKSDVSFNWDSFAGLQATSTLLPRIRSTDVQDALKTAQGHVIRSGSIELPSGMKVDEALISSLTLVNVQGSHGSLETNYQGSPEAPYIVFDMLTASPNFLAQADTVKRSSLTEGEALALWDAVSRSLRPRPNAF
ncbi:T6SS immunity protein Tli4 family protein [Burkholderia anthina]|uniref:T6SS immunity protein Tli4 family protein n=1 Tax=Burkholderia anthina TaxID=179879 RepID=UPI0015888648|nr:T6SS immunity protein Tli4 family protein [Burkholderia anthina]